MYTQTYYIYILTNKNKTTLYTGVTSDLAKRIYKHKNKLVPSFSSKYKLYFLDYYEECDDINVAIEREKYLKGKSRQYKNNFIIEFNPEWHNLYNQIII